MLSQRYHTHGNIKIDIPTEEEDIRPEITHCMTELKADIKRFRVQEPKIFNYKLIEVSESFKKTNRRFWK